MSDLSPFQFFRKAVWDAWITHLRGGDKRLLRRILSGGVWNGFLLSFVRGEVVPWRFCGGLDSDGHLFWECPHPPFVHIRESPEFRDLLLRDKSSWPRCHLWHGWLPALACTCGASPWAASVDDVACVRLERLLGSYSECICREQVPSDQFLDNVASSNVSDHPDVWTDGSFVLDELSVLGLAGVVFTLSSQVLVGLVVGGVIWSYSFLANLV